MIQCLKCLEATLHRLSIIQSFQIVFPFFLKKRKYIWEPLLFLGMKTTNYHPLLDIS